MATRRRRAGRARCPLCQAEVAYYRSPVSDGSADVLRQHHDQTSGKSCPGSHQEVPPSAVVSHPSEWTS